LVITNGRNTDHICRAVDRDFAFLGLMILPSLAAPEASRGRTRFFDAFQKYYAAGGVQTAPHIVKARYEVNRKHGVSEDDIAHFDLSLCTALLVNTVPAICWTLYHVFSNPMLLAKLRQGIEAVVFSKDTTLEPSSTTINIPQVIQAFPLLESLVKEVLRVESNNSSARFLLEDTVINDGIESTYLLKKGSFLAMLSSPVHNNKTIWGPTPETFDPERFLKREGNRIPASAYRTFGGGNALCPGRHFAMYEIMSILTIMVLKYDFEPLEGQWNIPQKGRHISTSILTPVKDVWVRIKSREEVQGLKWSFVWKTEKS
jgi:cytochrome P450